MFLKSANTALTVLFLTIPLIGLYFAIEGVLQGPNYFANCLITIERMDKNEYLVEDKLGDRRIKRDWVMAYSFLGGKMLTTLPPRSMAKEQNIFAMF